MGRRSNQRRIIDISNIYIRDLWKRIGEKLKFRGIEQGKIVKVIKKISKNKGQVRKNSLWEPLSIPSQLSSVGQ
jgi:hypothetical protein